MEILSPVKNLTSAKGVIQSGCDAIFLASPSFGARVNASIEKEEILDIINYCIDYEIKTYVTFNTIILEEEIPTFFEELDFIYVNNVDGIILQDYSFIEIIKKRCPDLEIHCSTQMHIHNSDGTIFVNKLGSNRIVVPREMNYKRIKKIKSETNIEIEAFIHGALCVSYSGQCYDSTLLDQKSANRGRCSQYCRMPQKIINKKTNQIVCKGNYPLSLKDLNNIDNVNHYLDAGVDSLKIEGRLKELSYATYVTKLYRNKIDGENVDSNELKRVYNRSFTSGRIDSVNGNLLVNQEKQNNNGVLIGEVKQVITNQKNFLFYRYIVEIKGKTIIPKDNIRFVFNEMETGQLVEQVYEKNNYFVYSNLKPEIGSKVYKTSDFKLKQKAKQVANGFNRKRKVFFNLIITDTISAIYKEKIIDTECKLEHAKNNPTTIKDINKMFNTDNSPFLFNISFEYNEKMFIPKKYLKSLKREIIKAIRYKKERKVENFLPNISSNRKMQDNAINYVEVRTIEQFNHLKDCNNTIILINNKELAMSITDPSQAYYVVPRVIYDDERYEIDKIVSRFSNLCISELGSLHRYNNKNLITNFMMNTTNKINQDFLLDNNVQKTVLSIELNFENYIKFSSSHSIINVYGRVPVMLMDYCPINLNKKDKCGSCKLCHSGNYYLEDNFNRQFPLLYEGDGRISMYSKKHINTTFMIDKFIKNGIKNFHYRLADEKNEEIVQLKNFLNSNIRLKKEEYLGNINKQIL